MECGLEFLGIWRWSERELTPSHLAWQMFCLEKLAPASSSALIKVASRSEILDRDRPQAYIIDSGRKPAELSHINARGRKLRTPKKTQEGASPQAHAGARRRPQAEGVWGREGGRLKSSCTQREGGEGRDSHPLYTPNTYIFITDIKKRCF